MELSLTTSLLIGIGALVGIGVLSIGLLVGHRRGVERGKLIALNQAAQQNDRGDMERLAGIGRAILSTQLRFDALCETIYQQSSRLVDVRNFQLGTFDGDDYLVQVWIRNSQRLPPQRFVGTGSEGLIGWVRNASQGLRVGDYVRDRDTLPAKPSYDAANPPRSALFAPLIAAGDVIGILAVQSDQPDAFTDEDLRLLTVLANLASGAMRNAQLFDQTVDRARQMRLINDISRQITAVQPIPNLLNQIVRRIDEAFHFYAVNVLLYDETTGMVTLGASSSAEYASRKLARLPGQGLIGTSYAEARMINVPDASTDQRFIIDTALPDTQSELCVPLAIENEVLGVLDLQSDQINGFNPDTASTMEALAGQLALALQEARSYAEVRRQADRIRALADASRAVVSILDLDDLLEEVVDLVTDYFGYDRVHLFLKVGDRVTFRSGSGVHSGKWAVDQLSYGIDDHGFIPTVARNGQPLVSGEVFTDLHYTPGPGVEDTRSEMTVPIRMGSRILGVLDVQSPQPHAFTDQDLTLALALSDTIAVGLRNASLFAAETRRRVLAETLREVSMVIAASLDLESVLDSILQGLSRVVTYQAALIALLDDDRAAYTISAVRADHAPSTVSRRKIPADNQAESAMFSFLHHLQPTQPALSRRSLIGEIEDEPNLPHHHIFAALPIGGETIGYLAIDRSTPDRFSSEETEIATAFGGQAAVAIFNAQLFSAQREQAWIATALLQVAEATGRATSLDDVLGTVARITPLLVGIQWCAVFLCEGDTFTVVEIEGLSEADTTAFRGYAIQVRNWPPLNQMCETGRPVIISRTTLVPPALPRPLPDIGQAVLLPLHAKGEIIGAMMIGQPDGADLLSDNKIALVSGIANQAALAIESAQLFAAQQEEQWVTTALLTVAESVNSTPDPHQTLETLTRLTPMLVGVSRCGLLQWDAETRCFLGSAIYGLRPEAEAQFRLLSLTTPPGSFAGALTIATEGIAAGTDFAYPIPTELALFDVPTILALPLVNKGILIGAMIVDHPDRAGVTDPRRMTILNGTAQQAAIALESARLEADSVQRQRLERELEVAQGIQRSFLPQQLPTLAGWDLSVFYRAARQVGGDFYDFIPLRDGKWGIVIADVADKGVPAALFMVLSRTNLRAAAFGREQPVETLLRVNELLLADSRSDLFVTCWYGVLNPISGELIYANAGHNPPILLRADGLSEELAGRGIALGVLDTIQIEERRVTLQPDDLLIAYTDGVTEAYRSDMTEFSVVGLQSTAAAVRSRSAADVIRKVVQTVDTFTAGEPQFDDLTLVALKRQG